MCVRAIPNDIDKRKEHEPTIKNLSPKTTADVTEQISPSFGYKCSGFSKCLPNPFTFQPEGNILCSVTYNDQKSALKDCFAFDCTHLLEYSFRGKSKH